MTPRDDRQDLFCLHCGYNLRGLSGDPRRCPECGRQSAVADMLIPADQIRKALRRLETGPALATSVVLISLCFLAMRWVAERAKRAIAPIQRARAAAMVREHRITGTPEVRAGGVPED
ncbi:MAG: hypothetical protein ACE5E5_00175 [Phycisphaerae bacterium]